MQSIDVHNLTHAQTREPPRKVSEFLRDDGSKNGINLLIEGDKKELINFLMTKIFCVSQNAYNMSPLNPEYLVMIELLACSVSDRNLLIRSIDSLFKGRNFFAP